MAEFILLLHPKRLCHNRTKNCCAQFLLRYIYMYAFFEVAVSVCLPRGGCISLPSLRWLYQSLHRLFSGAWISCSVDLCFVLPKSHPPASLPPAAWSTLVTLPPDIMCKFCKTYVQPKPMIALGSPAVPAENRNFRLLFPPPHRPQFRARTMPRIVYRVLPPFCQRTAQGFFPPPYHHRSG